MSFLSRRESTALIAPSLSLLAIAAARDRERALLSVAALFLAASRPFFFPFLFLTARVVADVTLLAGAAATKKTYRREFPGGVLSFPLRERQRGIR